ILDQLSIPNQLFENGWPENIVGFDKIWIAGGDGTIFYFINNYQSVNIPVALLGGGTGNDLKNHLYGDLPLEKHVHLLLESEVFDIDLGRCNDDYYINSLGIGFDGKVLQNIHTIRWVGGHWGYFLAVLGVI